MRLQTRTRRDLKTTTAQCSTDLPCTALPVHLCVPCPVCVSSNSSISALDEPTNSPCACRPWLALPYSQRDIKAALSAQYSVNGIPSLILLDRNGAVITADGRSTVLGDPQGDSWLPRSSSNLSRQASLDNDIERIGHGVSTEQCSAVPDPVYRCIAPCLCMSLCLALSLCHSTDCTP